MNIPPKTQLQFMLNKDELNSVVADVKDLVIRHTEQAISELLHAVIKQVSRGEPSMAYVMETTKMIEEQDQEPNYLFTLYFHDNKLGKVFSKTEDIDMNQRITIEFRPC